MRIYILLILSFFLPGAVKAASSTELETKKSYIEDIFIWRMSDELKLTAEEEKKFTAIHKDLNRKKAELNKDIQELTATVNENTEFNLKKLRQAIKSYNQISLDEFDSMKKLLGVKRFASYLQIKSELTNKVKLLLSGEKADDRRETAAKESNAKDGTTTPKLPPPQVILEK